MEGNSSFENFENHDTSEWLYLKTEYYFSVFNSTKHVVFCCFEPSGTMSQSIIHFCIESELFCFALSLLWWKTNSDSSSFMMHFSFSPFSNRGSWEKFRTVQAALQNCFTI